MKITVPARGLKDLLADALRAGTGDATHPGYSILHLETTKKGALRATTVNSLAALRLVYTPPEAGDFEPGAAAVPLVSAQNLANVLSGSEGVNAALSLVDQGPGRAPSMRLKSEDLLLKFPTHALEDLVPFPMPPDNDVTWQTVDGAVLQEIARRTLWCCAPASDARATLTGLHLTPTHVEAADGHRLVRYDIEGLVPKSVIVPAAAMSTAAALVGSGTVRLHVDDHRLWVQNRSFMLTCRLVDGPYPDTSRIYMRADDDGTVAVDAKSRAPLASAKISRSGLQSAAANMTKVFNGGGKDNRPVLRFLIRGQEMNVYMKNENGTGMDMAQRVPWQGDPGDKAVSELNALMVDAKYVEQVAGALPDAEFLDLRWVSSRDRIQLESGAMCAVIMPMAKS